MIQPINQQILCIGEMLWDRLPTGAKPGGAPMNVALHLKRLGRSPWFASRIGNDQAGEQLLDFLKENQMDTSLIQTDPELPTSQVLVCLDHHGNATYEICEPVAWDNLSLSPELAQKAASAGWIVVGSLAARNPVTRETLLKLLNSDAVKILDINLRPPFDRKEVAERLLHNCDMVKMNDEELARLTEWFALHGKTMQEQMAAVCLHFGVKAVCVTRGAHGAAFYGNDSYCEHPGYPVQVADTVGAGDAFLAGLIDAMIEKRPPEESLARACAVGALVASREGATPGYSPAEIEQIKRNDERR